VPDVERRGDVVALAMEHVLPPRAECRFTPSSRNGSSCTVQFDLRRPLRAFGNLRERRTFHGSTKPAIRDVEALCLGKQPSMFNAAGRGIFERQCGSGDFDTSFCVLCLNIIPTF
jgi:hypothetical protein